jgi:hypothetical protein
MDVEGSGVDYVTYTAGTAKNRDNRGKIFQETLIM